MSVSQIFQYRFLELENCLVSDVNNLTDEIEEVSKLEKVVNLELDESDAASA